MLRPLLRLYRDSHTPGWHRLVLLWALLAIGAAAGESKPALIRVVLDNDYPPYAFSGSDGRLEGLLVDEWALWEKKTGVHAELHGMDWGQALQRMENGEFDVIDTIFKTEARKEIFAFTEPYAQIEVPVFFEGSLSGITDIESLHGFQVGVKAGDAAADLLKEHGISAVLFRNYESIVEAARQHRLHVFVMDEPPAIYYLNKLGDRGEFRKTAPISVGAFHRAVRKDNRDLLHLVESGFAAVTPAEQRAIEVKWFGRRATGYRSLAYVGYGAAAALLLIAVLFGWNRALQRIVAQRSADLRESERRFRQVVENLEDLFWIRDQPSGRLVYISPAYEQLWGRSCESLYSAPDSWIENVHSDDRARVEALTKSGRAYDALFRIVQPGGTILWVRERAFTITDPKGAVKRTVGITSDVTQQKHFEQQVLRIQRMEAIGALSGGIAHDLNNILAPIMLSAALLKDTLTDAHQQELVAIIERGADRGAEVLRQLLIYSRGTDGQKITVRMAELLKEMASIVRETFPRNIALTVESAPTLPPVAADPTQLHQVLLNLCVNARDAMPEGGTLTLRVRVAEVKASDVRDEPDITPGPYVLLEIEDTGAGIPPDVVDRIFEPFFTTKEIGKGTGLGLSTVKGIVRSHGGFVTVASQLGRGSTFRVYLPAAEAALGEVTRGSNSPFAQGNGELVIVADDEESVRASTIMLLERNGYRAIGAANGREALTLVVEQRGIIRVLLTDIMMPVMGGVALTAAVRKIDPEIRVVAMTGLPQDPARADLQQLGVRELLFKPATGRDLLRAIKRALE